MQDRAGGMPAHWSVLSGANFVEGAVAPEWLDCETLELGQWKQDGGILSSLGVVVDVDIVVAVITVVASAASVTVVACGACVALVTFLSPVLLSGL